jgi:cysteinyl-tRNA synthetase
MSPVNSLIVNIYNTLTRRLEEIVPMKRGRIRLFVCGPTVFNFIHLGNARTFVLFDSLAKYLTASGYEVFYLQNITDIDDKTLKVAAQTGVPWQDVSSRFFEEYLRDMKALGVDSVNVYAKATLYMDEIRSQIRRLMNRGYAYETQDGVYFHVEKFRDMGELSGQKLDKVVPGSRVVPSEQKINPVDFVLWKKHKAGEPSWDSPWGPGRPGWHIEDTAITESFFGSMYDIHGGGKDLVFPHHEAEIGQMRAISGKKHLARYWIHGGYLNMGADKMSKSAGNFIMLREALKKYTRQQIRFFLLNANYASDLLYTEELFKASCEALDRIQHAYDMALENVDRRESNTLSTGYYLSRIKGHLDNNFDTRSVFATLLEMSSEIFRTGGRLQGDSASGAIETFQYVDNILGILAQGSAASDTGRIIEGILRLREEFRRRKDFSTSDMIRRILEDSGVRIEDDASGTKWKIG